MKKRLIILIIVFIAAVGFDLCAENAYSPKTGQTGNSLLSEQFIQNWFPGIHLELMRNYDSPFLFHDQQSRINTFLRLDQFAVDARDPSNWVVHQFNHTGLLASLLTYAAGFGLFVGGGGTATSIDLGVGLALMAIGVPINTAGCLMADFFLQGIHNKYKAKGAEISKKNVLLSWLLSGVGVGLTAGALVIPFVLDNDASPFIGIGLGGAAMIVNVFDFFLVKRAWLRDINVGIIVGGIR